LTATSNAAMRGYVIKGKACVIKPGKAKYMNGLFQAEYQKSR